MTKKYTCPMHPEVVTDKSGSCSKCGMDLVPVDKTQEDKAKAANCTCC